MSKTQTVFGFIAGPDGWFGRAEEAIFNSIDLSLPINANHKRGAWLAPAGRAAMMNPAARQLALRFAALCIAPLAQASRPPHTIFFIFSHDFV
jgi:hypothetical protein